MTTGYQKLCNGYLLVATLLIVAWCIHCSIADNQHIDLFIYSQGARLASEGCTPYDLVAINASVVEQYPDFELLHGNSGFFLAPQAILIFAPFAQMPWIVAKAVWSLLSVGLTAFSLYLMVRRVDPQVRLFLLVLLVGLTVCLRNIATFTLVLGQTTLLMMSLMVIGQALWEKGYRRLGALCWGLLFFKPHLAFALLPLAWWLDGWKRPIEVLLWAGLLNILAGVIFFANPLFPLEYVRFVEAGHSSSKFNRLADNLQLTSWNRVLHSWGGPAFEMGITRTLLGYALVSAWATIRGGWPQKAHANWYLAIAATMMLVCCQVPPYEMAVLLLAFPYLGEQILAEGSRSKLIAMIGSFILIVGWNWIELDPEVRSWILTWCPSRFYEGLQSQRSQACLLFLLFLLISGPPAIVNPTAMTSPQEESA